jgi:hypothetical protein
MTTTPPHPPDNLPVEKAEPLKRELEAFVAACRGEKAPLVDGQAGRQALATAWRWWRRLAEKVTAVYG